VSRADPSDLFRADPSDLFLIRHGSKPKKAVAARAKAIQIATVEAKTAIMSSLKAVLMPINKDFSVFFQRA